MILKCEILRKKFTFKTEKVGQETMVKFTHLFCHARNANTMNRKEIYRTYFGWNVISQHYSLLPCHKTSYLNVPMSSIKIKITRNGISPTPCFSSISSRRAAMCISMEACASVVCSVADTDSWLCTCRSHSTQVSASKKTICACVQRVLRCSLANIFNIKSYRKYTISQNLLAWPS